MSELIDRLVLQHQELSRSLADARKLGIASKQGREFLLQTRSRLLAHLALEDTKLYPVLREAALTDAQLRGLLEIFGEDMKEVTAEAEKFFAKYAQGGSDGDYVSDVAGLIARLKMRISNEEKVLYVEYERVTARRARSSGT